MKAMIRLLLFALMFTALASCSSKRDEVRVHGGQPALNTNQTYKIRVVDVSNNTGKIFDVDVIGMMWSGLDDSLKKRGLLWTEDSGVAPLKLEAHILKYKKGNILIRSLLPHWGKTELSVKCELKDGEKEIASVEDKEAVSIGSGSLTMSAWRKIFSAVSERIVGQLASKI